MGKALLELKQLNLSIPEQNRNLLDNINYQVYPKDFIIVLGSNGSGKSSLLKCINQTYQKTTGKILLNGKEISDYPQSTLAQDIVTLTQSTKDSLFMEMTIAENGLLWEMRMQTSPPAGSRNKKQAREKLQHYLAQFHQKLSQNLDISVAKLSGGEQQILVVALCLRYQPKLLLLDEHTSALDPKMEQVMMEQTYQFIKQQQVTCIMTTHRLDLALRYGNRLLSIDSGKIIYDVAAEQKQRLNRDKLLQHCYNTMGSSLNI